MQAGRRGDGVIRYDPIVKEVSMERLIATCGLVCTNCPAYLATRDKNTESMKRIAQQWSAEYGKELRVDDCWCNGCRSESGPWMSHCAECGIRACGVEKNLNHCGDCADYPCEKLTEFFGFVPDARKTLEAIRETR